MVRVKKQISQDKQNKLQDNILKYFTPSKKETKLSRPTGENLATSKQESIAAQAHSSMEKSQNTY